MPTKPDHSQQPLHAGGTTGAVSIFGRAHYFFAILFCFSLLAAVVIDWLDFYGVAALVYKKYVRASMLVLFLVFLCDPGFWRGKSRFPLAPPFLAFGFMILVYAVGQSALAGEIYYILKILYWVVGAFYAHRLLVNGLFPRKLFFFIIDIIVVFYFCMVLFTLLIASVKYSQNVSIYTLLWCLPILMLQKKSKIRTLVITLACFGVLLSFKRGAMIALVLSSMGYLFSYLLVKRSFRNILKVLLAVCLLAATVLVSIHLVSVVRPDFFNRRVADFSDKESYGSGRSEFYKVIVEHYLDAFSNDTPHFFFGFGSRSVQKLLADHYGVAEEHGAYAHSDWLQIMHDYGLVGLAIVAWLHLAVIGMMIVQFKSGKATLTPTVMNYIIFFLLNLYSGFFFTPNAVYFSIFLALAGTGAVKQAGSRLHVNSPVQQALLQQKGQGP